MVPWVVLGRLGQLLDQLWAPFGSFGSALGLPLAILWGPLGDLGVSWGSSAFLWFPRSASALGVPIGHPSASLWPTLVAVGHLLNALKIENPTVPYSLSKQSASVFFGIHLMILLIPAKWCCEVPLGAPLPHAPGVRMT